MKKFAFLLSLMMLMCSCARKQEAVKLLPVAELALYDTESIYYQDYEHYSEDLSQLPIGVLDCTMDGYSVMESFLTTDHYDNITGTVDSDGIVDFGGERFQFLLDLANGPYLGYITQNNVDFLKEQVLRNVIFLTGKSYYNLAMDEVPMGIKTPVKLVVVASQVADYKVLEDINCFLDATGSGVKALGVMTSGIDAMFANASVSEDMSICVIYPSQGLRSRDYEDAISGAAANFGHTGQLNIFSQEAEGLTASIIGDKAYVDSTVSRIRYDYKGPQIGISYNNIDISLIERYNFCRDDHALLAKKRPDGTMEIQLNSIENYIRYYLVSVIERHRRSGSPVPISRFYLADFKYHQIAGIVNEVIAELYNYRKDGMYLYRGSIAADYKVIDPVQCAVQQCYAQLRENDLLALRGAKSELLSFITLPSSQLSEEYITPQGDIVDSIKYCRASENMVLTTKQHPFDPRYLEENEMANVAKTSPNTFLLISNSLY